MAAAAVPVVAEAGLDLTNEAGELARLKDWVEEIGHRLEIPADRLFEIKTALYEAVANVICHGFDDTAEHRIGVRLRVSERAVETTVDDDGRPFDPLAALPRRQATTVGEAEIGGRGILLMRSFSDGMHYERVGGRNRLTLIRSLPPPR